MIEFFAHPALLVFFAIAGATYVLMTLVWFRANRISWTKHEAKYAEICRANEQLSEGIKRYQDSIDDPNSISLKVSSRAPGTPAQELCDGFIYVGADPPRYFRYMHHSGNPDSWSDCTLGGTGTGMAVITDDVLAFIRVLPQSGIGAIIRQLDGLGEETGGRLRYEDIPPEVNEYLDDLSESDTDLILDFYGIAPTRRAKDDPAPAPRPVRRRAVDLGGET